MNEVGNNNDNLYDARGRVIKLWHYIAGLGIKTTNYEYNSQNQRDASGKEIAIYQGYSLDYWNVWGTGNVGRIKSNGVRYFYLKDHLGSIRAVINESNTIVQSQDYDPWGHLARSWDTTTSTYKFTGKERDQESNYDYFGARYYDSRVGRWGGVEPLLEKYFSYSPYQYGLLNPMRLVDANGKDVYIFGNDSKATVEYMNEDRESTGLTFSINNDGKLSVTGKPLNDNAKIIYNAINSDDIKVGMYTLRRDIIDESDQNTYMNVGTYMGNFDININAIKNTIAIQYFNLPQAVAYHDAGGSSVALSAFHEIKEAFIGAYLFPGAKGFEKAHALTESTDPKGLLYPGYGVDYERKLYYNKIIKEKNAKAEKVYPDYKSN